MSDPVNFIHGPTKNDLSRSAKTAASLPATFDTAEGILSAQIEQVEDHGSRFEFWGRLLSAELHGAFFTGSYDTDTGHGQLAFKIAA